MAVSNSDTVILPDAAISLSDFQNASSRLTLVLWPARTTDRFTTRDFICASERLRLVGSHFTQRSRHRGSAVRIKIIPEENLCGHRFSERSRRTVLSASQQAGRPRDGQQALRPVATYMQLRPPREWLDVGR